VDAGVHAGQATFLVLPGRAKVLFAQLYWWGLRWSGFRCG
jgi:hypothetical protein